MSTTWILIANASEAHLYKAHHAKLLNGAESLEHVKDFSHPESRSAVKELVSDRNGRNYSAAFGNHTFTDRADHHQREVELFAREILDDIEQNYNSKAFDELIMAAPPQFHGALNQLCSKQLRKACNTQIDKDYTKLDQRELLKQIQSYL